MLGVCLALIDDENNKSEFVRIYNAYYSKMLGLAVTILKSRSLAEDAVADAFLGVAGCFQKVHNLPVREFEAYLVITVRNTSINILNK